MPRRQELDPTIKGIVSKLATEYSPQQIILFGSHASGTARQDSDIDLLIIKETPERFIDRWMTVRQILSDPSRSIPLETLVMTPKEVAERLNAGDQFVREILERGRVLYAA